MNLNGRPHVTVGGSYRALLYKIKENRFDKAS
jgi:hypothetical protein